LSFYDLQSTIYNLQSAMVKQPLFQHLNQLATDRWARQGVRTLLRAAWLGASIWCIGLGGHLLWGWSLRPGVLGALALGMVGAAVLLLLRPRLSPQEAARRLDRRFHLDEQLATAVEVAITRPPPDTVAARLVVQSAATARSLNQRIARHQRPPWNEVLTLLALLPLALGLYILSGIGRADLNSAALPLPPLVAPQDPAQQLAEQPRGPDQPQPLLPGAGAPASGVEASQPGASTGQTGATGDPRTLQALADALRDQGATRPAAEALDRGDLGGAAQRLRELADQADQLSQSARDDLAESLRGAAQRIAPANPSLADQLRRSAEGLEQGGQKASQALDDLARAIEGLQTTQAPAGGDQGQTGQQGGQTGQQGGQSGDQGAQSGDQGGQGDAGQGANPGGAGRGAAGEQRPAGRTERLGVPGQPVPLDTEGPGQVAAEPSDRPPTTSNVVPGTTGGDSSSDRRVQIGTDPLRVPLDERDVVQNYFRP
jgi:hypothetical protein